jgi:hypothetical protein
MTSRRQSSGGILSMDVIPEFCEHLKNIPKEMKEVDLLISSEGGDPIAAWRIVNLLRERFDKIGVLIPYTAKSAATVLALGADEIVMHPFSCLGPIDMQINISNSAPGQIKQFSTEDVTSYLNFLQEDLRVPERLFGTEASKTLLAELKPTDVGIVKKSITFIKSIATKLLEIHMDDKEAIKEIVDKFTSFSHHGYTIGRKEAIALKLPVVTDFDEDLEELIWKIWEDADREMKCKVPFDPLAIIGSNKELMDRLNKVQVSLPSGAPLTTQRIENIIDESIVALVESDNMRSYFKSKAIISAVRGNNLSIVCNVAIVSIGWITKYIGGEKDGSE